MPEPVGVDPATLSTLADRVEQAATELLAAAIPGVEGLPGSVLGGLQGPSRAAADVRRLGTAVQAWVLAARHAADRGTADRLRPR